MFPVHLNKKELA